jgi:alkylhydroperoxidase/carboxymuconolactone decarboxylase family protein YurZ
MADDKGKTTPARPAKGAGAAAAEGKKGAAAAAGTADAAARAKAKEEERVRLQAERAKAREEARAKALEAKEAKSRAREEKQKAKPEKARPAKAARAAEGAEAGQPAREKAGGRAAAQAAAPAGEPQPPGAYHDFVTRFPKLGQAWNAIREAEKEGALDRPTRRLVKLAVAVGAMREGAVHSAARKARAAGASNEDILQVVALAASTIGMPSTVAVYTWIRDVLGE